MAGGQGQRREEVVEGRQNRGGDEEAVTGGDSTTVDETGYRIVMRQVLDEMVLERRGEEEESASPVLKMVVSRRKRRVSEREGRSEQKSKKRKFISKKSSNVAVYQEKDGENIEDMVEMQEEGAKAKEDVEMHLLEEALVQKSMNKKEEKAITIADDMENIVDGFSFLSSTTPMKCSGDLQVKVGFHNYLGSALFSHGQRR